MSGTIVVDVRKAVTDGLSAYFKTLPAFNGDDAPEHAVDVRYAYNFGGSQPREQIFTGRSRADTPPAAMRAGRNAKAETATFELVVLVEAVASSPEEADRRVSDIGSEVEDWLGDRKSNQLGVTGLETIVVAGWELATLGNDRGYLAELTYTVRYTARIL